MKNILTPRTFCDVMEALVKKEITSATAKQLIKQMVKNIKFARK